MSSVSTPASRATILGVGPLVILSIGLLGILDIGLLGILDIGLLGILDTGQLVMPIIHYIFLDYRAGYRL